jgi:hypothetical protein
MVQGKALCCCLAVTAWAWAVLSTGANGMPVSPGFRALAIDVAALPNEVPALGGTVLRVTVMNPAPMPVGAHRAIRPGSPFLQLFVRRPGRDYEPISPGDWDVAMYIAPPSDLAPGFSSTFETTVWWGAFEAAPAQAFLAEPGDLH